MSNPSGGPKDTTPPKVLISNPDSGQLNVDTREIWLEFDEYIKTNNINELLIISPRLADRYETSVKKKRLTITFPEDSLQENTTYTVSLNGSIVDVNESNPLEDYQLFFSTGSTIDSLSYSAVIIDAFTKKPCEECVLSFYLSDNDSVVLQEKPEYLSRTNTSGRVLFEHLPAKTFRAVAIKDLNKNLKLDADEQVSLFQNIKIKDGLGVDTFYVFDFKPLVDLKAKLNRSYPGVIKLSFEEAVDLDSLTVLLNDSAMSFTANRTQDTLTSYVNINEQDTFPITLIFPSDTQKLFYTPSPLKSSTYGLRTSRIDKSTIVLKHAHLLDTFYKEGIRIIQDSAVKYIDSFRIDNNLLIVQSALNESPILLKIDSNTLEDINGSFARIDSFQLNFKEVEGAHLSLDVKSERKNPLIVQLVEGSSVLYEHRSNGSIKLNYPTIKSGTYYIRIIHDSNNNGRWDRGDFFLNKPPETITISEIISLRNNWDKELIINI